MLEIIVPFLLLRTDKFPLMKCYAYFKSFMKKYFPHCLTSKFLNNEAGLPYTHLVMNVSELLLKYHAPEILKVFKKFKIDLKFFLTSWVMTLFIQGTPIFMCYLILNEYITRGKRVFIFYMIIARILLYKERILKFKDFIDETELLEMLSKSFKIKDE